MDKKVLILLPLLLAGCMNDMEYRRTDTTPQLVMNALMDTDEAQHRVFLSLSRPGYVDTLTGPATVRCYVNGSLAATAEEQPSYLRKQRLFVFSAGFRPGDEVRLTASAEGYEASSTVQVFDEPVLGQVDTLTEGDKLAFKVELTDKNAGADYYSIAFRYAATVEFYKDGVLERSSYYQHRCAPDFSDDLILAEENIAASNMDMFDFGTPNRWGTFFDSQFDRSTVVLRPKLYKTDLQAAWAYSTDYDTVVVHGTVELRLSHIGVRHYYYLKALSSLDGGMGDLSLEDVAIPDNVSGGTGFVGISTPAFKYIHMPEYSFKMLYYEGE